MNKNIYIQTIFGKVTNQCRPLNKGELVPRKDEIIRDDFNPECFAIVKSVTPSNRLYGYKMFKIKASPINVNAIKHY